MFLLDIIPIERLSERAVQRVLIEWSIFVIMCALGERSEFISRKREERYAMGVSQARRGKSQLKLPRNFLLASLRDNIAPCFRIPSFSLTCAVAGMFRLYWTTHQSFLSHRALHCSDARRRVRCSNLNAFFNTSPYLRSFTYLGHMRLLQ